MKYLRRLLATLLLLSVAVACLSLVEFLRRSGEFKALDDAPDLACRPILAVRGSRDLVLDPESRTLFICADTGGTETGAVYALDLSTPGSEPVELVPSPALEFHPHAIAFFRQSSGERSLFVANRRAEGWYVEVYDIQDHNLFPREIIALPGDGVPGDLIAAGPDSFYLTLNPPGLGLAWRVFFFAVGWGRSRVLYYSSGRFSAVVEGLAWAEGIAASGETIYIADTVSGCLLAYSIRSEPPGLDQLVSLRIDDSPDGVEAGSDGSLWVACHPGYWSFDRFSRNHRIPAPSKVLRVIPETLESVTVFSDRGDYLSGATAAVASDGQLLIGSAQDRRLLLCSLP